LRVTFLFLHEPLDPQPAQFGTQFRGDPLRLIGQIFRFDKWIVCRG
jgi:hypothetical protein